MFLHEVFSPGLIKIGLGAESKKEAFEEMTDYFCKVNETNMRWEILHSLHQRESKMSTGISKGIAIPHGKINALDKIFGIIGISRKGIDYDALDGQPVHILFMLLAPDNDSELHLRLLKRLTKLLDIPGFYEQFLAQTDSQDAHELVKKYEETHILSP